MDIYNIFDSLFVYISLFSYLCLTCISSEIIYDMEIKE